MSEETIPILKARIAELEQTIQALKTDLIHDGLTGLKTRKFFENEAKVYYKAVTERHYGVRREWFGFRNMSFIFFDLDHFKKINDEHGHQVGDGVLRAVAQKIKEGVREGDIAARYGGEEIIVALLGANEKTATQKAESIRRGIEYLAFNNLPGMQVTVSAGVAAVEDKVSFEETIARADKAMYEAKNTGRNKIISYSEIAKN